MSCEHIVSPCGTFSIRKQSMPLSRLDQDRLDLAVTLIHVLQLVLGETPSPARLHRMPSWAVQCATPVSAVRNNSTSPKNDMIQWWSDQRIRLFYKYIATSTERIFNIRSDRAERIRSGSQNTAVSDKRTPARPVKER